MAKKGVGVGFIPHLGVVLYRRPPGGWWQPDRKWSRIPCLAPPPRLLSGTHYMQSGCWSGVHGEETKRRAAALMLNWTGSAVRASLIAGPDQWGPVGTIGLASGCAVPGKRISSSSSGFANRATNQPGTPQHNQSILPFVMCHKALDPDPIDPSGFCVICLLALGCKRPEPCVITMAKVRNSNSQTRFPG